MRAGCAVLCRFVQFWAMGIGEKIVRANPNAFWNEGFMASAARPAGGTWLPGARGINRGNIRFSKSVSVETDRGCPISLEDSMAPMLYSLTRQCGVRVFSSLGVDGDV